MRALSPPAPQPAVVVPRALALCALALAVGALAVGGAGCVEHAPARFDTASRLPDDEARADGVAVDLTSDPPPGHYGAHTVEQVVALKAPLGERAALDTVRSFFEAVAREDISALTALTDDGARLHDLRQTSRKATHYLTSIWRQRFSKHKYEQLPAQQVYRESVIATFQPEHIQRLPAAVRHALPLSKSQELVLVVPIATAGVGNERFFGNELFFLLRAVGGRYLIAGVAERVPY